MTKWRTITGDEPDNSGVIVAVTRFDPKRYIVGEAYKLDRRWWWAQESSSDNYASPVNPTHWMPLPKPPK